MIDYSGLKLRAGLPLTVSTGRTVEAGENTVASKINGLEVRPVRVAAGTAVSKAGTEKAPAQPKGSQAPGADVQITRTARGLAALEQSVRDLPAVDQARVAAIRQRLDDGSYQVDPQRIADTLLRMERDLANGKGGK